MAIPRTSRAVRVSMTASLGLAASEMLAIIFRSKSGPVVSDGPQPFAAHPSPYFLFAKTTRPAAATSPPFAGRKLPR